MNNHTEKIYIATHYIAKLRSLPAFPKMLDGPGCNTGRLSAHLDWTNNGSKIVVDFPARNAPMGACRITAE